LQIVEKWDGKAPLVIGGGENTGTNFILPLGTPANAPAGSPVMRK